MSSVVQEESFSKAEELLHVLWRQDKLWRPFPRHWVFRGQGSSEWELHPSAFRAGLEVYYGPSTPFRPCERHGDQVLAEAMIVKAFLAELDRQGIPPPTESAHPWHDIFRMFGDLMEHGEGGPWPPEELAPLFGLAQHHGIPTRLLDWSERPLVAAYFAALDASIRIEAGRAEAGDQLAVWAFDYEEADSLFTLLEEEERYPRFEIVRPPRVIECKKDEQVQRAMADHRLRFRAARPAISRAA